MKLLPLSMILIAGIFVALCEVAHSQVLAAEATRPESVQVYFGPRDGMAEVIVAEIEAAKTSVLVQAYSFDYLPFAWALEAAKKRNIEVSVILDKDKTKEEKAGAVSYLVKSGVTTRLDGAHHTAHNKVIIIDGAVVITGSLNFTRNSVHANAENLLVIRDKALAEKYVANWQKHAKHSKPYDIEDTSKPVK